MPKIGITLIVGAAVIWTGCGGAEQREATSFYQTLNQKQADLAAINALEKDLMGSTRSWCEGIVSNGGGKGKGLEQNAASAKQLAESAGVVATDLSQLRQSIYDIPLKEDYPQEVRGTLINQIMSRQKMLQQVRSALTAAAAGFLDFAQSRSYNGDTYPSAIDQLSPLVSRYRGPEDAIGKALEDLRVKYQLPAAAPAGKS